MGSTAIGSVPTASEPNSNTGTSDAGGANVGAIQDAFSHAVSLGIGITDHEASHLIKPDFQLGAGTTPVPIDSQDGGWYLQQGGVLGPSIIRLFGQVGNISNPASRPWYVWSRVMFDSNFVAASFVFPCTLTDGGNNAIEIRSSPADSLTQLYLSIFKGGVETAKVSLGAPGQLGAGISLLTPVTLAIAYDIATDVVTVYVNNVAVVSVAAANALLPVVPCWVELTTSSSANAKFFSDAIMLGWHLA